MKEAYTGIAAVCTQCGYHITGPHYYSDISGNGPWCPTCFSKQQDELYGMPQQRIDHIKALEVRVAELTRGWNEASAARHRLLLEVKVLDARVAELEGALGAAIAARGKV